MADEEDKSLKKLLRDAAEVNQRLQAALEVARPKVEAFDDLMDSDGTCTLGRAAKVIGWPGTHQEFYQYLIDKRDIFIKINYDLYPHKREYWPDQGAARKRYYKSDVRSVQCGDRKVITHTTKVTAPGLDHLRRLIKKDFELEDDE